MVNIRRLSRTGIEYLDYCWNFYSGCHHKQLGVCPPEFTCWAESITKRFKDRYSNGFEPAFYPRAFLSPLSLKKAARIGCAFMGDLFGDWVNPDSKIRELPLSFETEDLGFSLSCSLREIIFNVIEARPEHTFIFLTKNPKGLLRWSPFPDNCEVGFTACNREMLKAGCYIMHDVDARVKFVSIEPMLEETWVLSLSLIVAGIPWVIIGAQTKPFRPPKAEWVELMVDVADYANAKVFLKNNLWPLLKDIKKYPWAFNEEGRLRQELPEHSV